MSSLRLRLAQVTKEEREKSNQKFKLAANTGHNRYNVLLGLASN